MEAGSERTQLSGREFASTLESIGATRDFVRESMAAAAMSEEAVGDIQLAVSELVTNAVVHGNGDPIAVQIETSVQAIVCSVLTGFSGSPPPDPALWDPAAWTAPSRGGPTGRGLAIVRAVADAVVVDIDDSVVTVRCTFERR